MYLTASTDSVVNPDDSVDAGTNSHSNSSTHDNKNGNDIDDDRRKVGGISIHGWKIFTSQGPIGDSQWFEEATNQLEPMSQPNATKDQQDDHDAAAVDRHFPIKRRQLTLPEMIFPSACIVLDYDYPYSDNNDSGGDGDGEATSQQHHVRLSVNAMDFLQEWAELHQDIPLPNQGDDNTSALLGGSRSISTPTSKGDERILEISHASLWKHKMNIPGNDDQIQEEDDIHHSSTTMTNAIGSTTFHYDWTYSSPYCGKLMSSLSSSSDLGTHPIVWTESTKSGMPMHLLTDTRVPILLFDQIVFVEDDLHDNGQIQFSAKIRIMPTCAYILTQLFIRVDHVLIRVRESRWMIEFSSTQSNNKERESRDMITTETTTAAATTATGAASSKSISVEQKSDRYASRPQIHRDITWRECKWQDLPKYHLPTNVQSWTQNEAWRPQDAAAFAQLLQRIPMVDLPSHLPPHSQYVVGDGMTGQ